MTSSLVFIARGTLYIFNIFPVFHVELEIHYP